MDDLSQDISNSSSSYMSSGTAYDHSEAGFQDYYTELASQTGELIPPISPPEWGPVPPGQRPEDGLEDADAGEDSPSGKKRRRRGEPTSGRKAKGRTSFTKEQTYKLEEMYAQKRYLELDERDIVAQQVGLPPRQSMIWFQNKRMRVKMERRKQGLEPEEVDPDELPTHLSSRGKKGTGDNKTGKGNKALKLADRNLDAIHNNESNSSINNPFVPEPQQQPLWQSGPMPGSFQQPMNFQTPPHMLNAMEPSQTRNMCDPISQFHPPPENSPVPTLPYPEAHISLPAQYPVAPNIRPPGYVGGHMQSPQSFAELITGQPQEDQVHVDSSRSITSESENAPTMVPAQEINPSFNSVSKEVVQPSEPESDKTITTLDTVPMVIKPVPLQPHNNSGSCPSPVPKPIATSFPQPPSEHFPGHYPYSGDSLLGYLTGLLPPLLPPYQTRPTMVSDSL